MITIPIQPHINSFLVPKLAQIPVNTLRNPSSTLKRSKGFVFSRGPDKGLTQEEAQKIQNRFRANEAHEIQKKQNVALSADQYLKAIFGCCIIMTILVLLPPANPWVIVFVKLSGGVTVGLGFLLIRALISSLFNYHNVGFSFTEPIYWSLGTHQTMMDICCLQELIRMV